MAPKSDDSGMLVYPKLPVPKQGGGGRDSAPKIRSGGDGGYSAIKIVLALLVAAGLGAAGGYFLSPKKQDTAAVAKIQKDAAAAETAARVEKDRADGAHKQLEVVTKEKQALETQLTAAEAKLAENAKQAEAANAAAQQKLQAAVDKSTGEVSTEGEEIHLKLVDKVLFAVGDDQLTDKGKAVLAKVGKALADLPDKQIWVQGHTDDTPIAAPAPKTKKPAKKGAKTEPPPPGPRFASNWELSAARALQVVHYLQDTAKLDPSRLAALAFGEYRPVSKTNKAVNRRIEIVLYPHKAVIERETPAKPAKKK